MKSLPTPAFYKFRHWTILLPNHLWKRNTFQLNTSDTPWALQWNYHNFLKLWLFYKEGDHDLFFFLCYYKSRRRNCCSNRWKHRLDMSSLYHFKGAKWEQRVLGPLFFYLLFISHKIINHPSCKWVMYFGFVWK